MAVQIIDRGWDRIVRELRLADNSFTEVGLQKGSKRKFNLVPSGATGKTGKKARKTKFKRVAAISDMVTIGAVHEFGAPARNIPARPFMRTAFDENQPRIRSFVNSEYDKILVGTSTTKRALGRIGELHQAQVQKKITDIDSPALAQSTIDRKGSTNPLIDTGQMRQSIRHVERLI